MSDQSHDRSDNGTTVAEAARILGITEGAVRKRVERGKMEHEHAPDGQLIVYLEGGAGERGATATDTTRDRPRQSRDTSAAGDRYTRSLEEQVAYLRSQLEEEREANRENRRIIAALTSRIPAIEAPQEATDAPETVEETPEGTGHHSAAGEVWDELDTERARREMAESTLHEGMDEERRRREEAERERDDLRRELFAFRQQREAAERADQHQGRGPPRPATPEAQEGVQRPWWRRVFGG